MSAKNVMRDFVPRCTPDNGPSPSDKPDVHCPKCNHPFKLDYLDFNDGYYTPAVIENYTITITCICGCEFVAGVESVVVEFFVKECS